MEEILKLQTLNWKWKYGGLNSNMVYKNLVGDSLNT